jgi:phosphate-selective porin OprO and OprP
MRFRLLFVLFFITFSSKAQDLKFSSDDNDLRLATIPYYNYGRGLGLTSPDSIFQLNIRFRMQNRVSYLQWEDEEEIIDGQIRRLRLRFDGFIGNPRFLYAIQLSFAPGDVGEIEEGENVNIIRDAVIFYRPNANWSIAFGQTKIPGNRQRVNSSGALQLSDRSINNARFNIDRDFGFQVYYLREDLDQFSYNLKTAVTTGNGRNVTNNPDNGFALTGKLELFPLGAFEKDGTNFEGDLYRESKPKLMLSGAFHRNVKARLTQGVIGDDLFEKRTMESILLDGMFKYNGWAFMTTFMNRVSKNPITINPNDPSDIRFVYVGQGTDYQLSYVFPNHLEFIGRFSNQRVYKNIALLAPDTRQFTFGITKYIWEHAFKLQTEVSFDQHYFLNGVQREGWSFRFQVEIGI